MSARPRHTLRTLRRLRMILNTFVSGPQAWFFLAGERGYLRDQGIALEFTPGDTGVVHMRLLPPLTTRMRHLARDAASW